MTEDAAYKLCWPRSFGTWRRTEEDRSGYLVEGHSQIARWGVGGSYGIGGSRGCMRSCFDHHERRGMCEQAFHGGPFIRRDRWLLPTRCGATPSE